MDKPLKGLRMLDLSRVLAGPYCSMILTDLGVETIKIEMPGTGDDSRRFPPFVGGESAYFMSLNRNKRSMTLNLKKEEGKSIFLGLAETADIILENFRPGTMDSLGLGYDRLASINNRLIYASCSGFGKTGPYSRRPAYDLIVQAMGGMMSITGPDKDHPTRAGSSLGDIIAGMYTAIGILAAVTHRNSTGEGQFVDVAMLDCQISVLENAIARYAVTGVNPEPIGNRHPAIAPFGEFRTRDGRIVICAGNDRLFVNLCTSIGLNHLAADERFLTNEARTANVEVLTCFLDDRLSTDTSESWIDVLHEAGVPCGPINSIGEALGDPQVLAREMVQEISNSRGVSLTMPGIPIKFSKTPGSIDAGAPLLGEHTEEILTQELKLPTDEVKRLTEEGIL